MNRTRTWGHLALMCAMAATAIAGLAIFVGASSAAAKTAVGRNVHIVHVHGGARCAA